METREWKTDLDAGIRWGIPPNPFVRARARRYAYLSDWEMRATQSLYYYTLDGWGETTDLRMDYPLNTEKLFRVSASAEYLLDNDYFDFSYSLSLYHELRDNAVLAYSAGATGDSQQEATFYQYFAGLRYRRLIYSNWIYGEVTPQFEWRRDEGYRTVPVIMFRLEAVVSDELL